MKKLNYLFVGLLATILLCACGSGGDSDSGSNDDNGGSTTNLTSVCGVIQDGSLKNPVSNAEYVGVDVVTADTVIITHITGAQAGGSQLIKLQGITTDGVEARLVNQAKTKLESIAGSAAYLVIANQSCSVTVVGGGIGTYGQLFTSSGANVNEQLLATGGVIPASDSCGGDQLVSCYQGIPVNEATSDMKVGHFIWKPVSESDGNLVCLTDIYGVTFVVRGAITETLNDVGPGAGYGSRGRANRPGCSYGSNITVDMFDYDGKRILTNSGLSYITIPNGCSRVDTLY